MSQLQNENSFPYDALDEIFSYTVSCHHSDAALEDRKTWGRKQALTLAIVCRFWHQRFLNSEAMWRVIIRQSPFASAANWTSHTSAKRAYLQAKSLTPLLQEELTPIEDCSFSFQCPMYVEDLTYKGDRTYFCDGCKKNVYHVLTDEEKQMRAAKGDCVMLFAGTTDRLKNQRNRIPPADLLKYGKSNEPLPLGTKLPKAPDPKMPGYPTSMWNVRSRIAVLAKDEEDLMLRVKPMLRYLSSGSGEGYKVRCSHNCFPTITVEVERDSQLCTFYFHAMLESEAQIIIVSDLLPEERFTCAITADPTLLRFSSTIFGKGELNSPPSLPVFNRPTPLRPDQDPGFAKLALDNPALSHVCASLFGEMLDVLAPAVAPPPIMMGVPLVPTPMPPKPTLGSLPSVLPPNTDVPSFSSGGKKKGKKR